VGVGRGAPAPPHAARAAPAVAAPAILKKLRLEMDDERFTMTTP
jgi:hypothetical protein